MTNFEYIKEFDIEKFGKLLGNNIDCSVCKSAPLLPSLNCNHCLASWRDWLSAELDMEGMKVLLEEV